MYIYLRILMNKKHIEKDRQALTVSFIFDVVCVFAFLYIAGAF